MKILNTLEEWLEMFPPIQQPMRYGNKAFRNYFDHVQENGEELMNEILPEEYSAASPELTSYLVNSLGNKTRIDYGTGHETCFVAWMWCLEILGLTNQDDHCALVFKVFSPYIDLMRKIQSRYFLEPAGSHGVWSLDDYQFLPFYFGSGQLCEQSRIKPIHIHNQDYLEEFSGVYMYFSCIKFIHRMKTGPFGEHSPILNDISGVELWSKVNKGMMKMYKVEVLSKFPIMQHFLFGSLITLE
eukprot:TRINITY_DN959_c0_g1_i3.p1 TRINITY_DN959_c0_g1~~TRINITY_DN959_c0_g1_i3.p1  ORF type:complete len:242 (+),score=69.74 TRINITY_DN959_c0_g1_i3:228-953(+)